MVSIKSNTQTKGANMRQLTVNGSDVHNFYSWHVYVDQRNEYGEYIFNDKGELLVDEEQFHFIVAELIGMPPADITIYDWKL
jgi:hypothetical protein